MWESFLCKLGMSDACGADDDLDRLEEKIRIILYRPTTFEHLRTSKHLIQKYEKLMYASRPLTNIKRYDSLIKLWELKFKLWKRG